MVSVIMLNFIMLNVIMLNVIMLNVIMLSVVAYFFIFKISGTLAFYNNIFVSQTEAKNSMY